MPEKNLVVALAAQTVDYAVLNQVPAMDYRQLILTRRFPVATPQPDPPNSPAQTFASDISRPGVLYTALDNTSQYFIPQAVVSKRHVGSQTPSVFIRRERLNPNEHAGLDHRDTLEVTFDLLRASGIPVEAQLLPPWDHFVASVRLHPKADNDPAIDFTVFPKLPPDSGAGATPTATDGGSGLVAQLYASADVTANLANILNILQEQNGSWFEVQVPVVYWFQPATPPGTPPAPSSPSPHQTAHPLKNLSPYIAATQVVKQADKFSQHLAVSDKTLATLVTVAAANPAPPPPPAQQRNTMVLLNGRDMLSAFFPTTIPQNRFIYAMVTSSFGQDADTVWIDSPDGYFMESATPNQYFVLPDGYGIAFDSAVGMPRMTVLLLKTNDAAATGAAAYRVRVSLSVAPWLDSQRLDRLRQHIRQYTSGAVAYASLVVGGTSATFEPTHLFDQLGMSILDGDSAAAQHTDAASGFDMVMDCTIEFYTLLTKLLTGTSLGGSQGLQGQVSFMLRTSANADALPVRRNVTVNLRLDQPANHPVTWDTPAEIDALPASPPATINVAVRNPSPVPVAVAHLITNALRIEGLPYPVDAAPAAVDPSTLQLGANSETSITVTLPAPKENWDHVAVSFGNVKVQIDPAAALNRVQEFAASSGLKTTVHLRSYLLENPAEIPPELTGLIGIHVQLGQGAAVPMDLTLSRENPEQVASLAFSLADILAGMSPDQPNFKYRRQNIFAAKPASSWTDWETNNGNELFIAPAGL